MRLLLIAVGQRLPAWAQAACEDFIRRLGRGFPLELIEVRAEPRSTGRSRERILDEESRRIVAAIPAGARRVALDERGTALTTREWADRLERWRGEGRDLAMLIGGPDGLAPELVQGADFVLQLSRFTLPHALARVLLVEQVYRAAALIEGHPYHRD